MEFMSATIQGLPESKLAADEADFLCTFYVDRLKGESEIPLLLPSILLHNQLYRFSVDDLRNRVRVRRADAQRRKPQRKVLRTDREVKYGNPHGL